MIKHKVYIIGAGPGKADLITLRGAAILQEADVIIYDYLVDKKILEYAKPGAELICCDQLAKKGRFADGFIIDQEKIHKLLVKKARQGKKVARLKNGDPVIFSRFTQELEALSQAGLSFEIVPGVTAASAAAAFSGLALTDRKIASSCTLVTGHEDPLKDKSMIDWPALVRSGTLVFYMAVENLTHIVNQLISAGKKKDTPVAIVQNASLISQKVVRATLGSIVTQAKKDKIKSPAIIIVGEVVNLAERFDWLKKSRKVLFTGLSSERFFSDGFYFHLPLIKIEPLKNYKEFDNYLRKINKFNWIVFSSRYGVKYFFEQLQQLNYDCRKLAKIKLACIGQSTARALLGQGLQADLVPALESSKGLIKAFKEIDLKGKKVFLPRSDLSDKGLKQALKKQGASVVSCFAYRNVMPSDLPSLDLKSFDEIIFSSPSTVKNFKKHYQSLPPGIKIKSLGAVTKKAVKECQLLS